MPPASATRQRDAYSYWLAAVTPPAAPTGADKAALLNRLQNEFDEWWGPKRRHYYDDPYTRKPGITDWRNIEDFLRDRYPGSVIGADWGEDAAAALNSKQYSRLNADDVVAAGMLALHNKAQGRHDESLFYPNPLDRMVWEREHRSLIDTVADEQRAV